MTAILNPKQYEQEILKLEKRVKASRELLKHDYKQFDFTPSATNWVRLTSSMADYQQRKTSLWEFEAEQREAARS